MDSISWSTSSEQLSAWFATSHVCQGISVDFMPAYISEQNHERTIQVTAAAVLTVTK